MKKENFDIIKKESVELFQALDKISNSIKEVEKTLRLLPLKMFSIKVEDIRNVDDVWLIWRDGRIFYESSSVNKPLIECKVQIRLDMKLHLDKFTEKAIEELKNLKEKMCSA